MKKVLSILLVFCLIANILLLFVYAAPFTDEISFDKFTDGFVAVKNNYDKEYIGDIVIKNGKSYYTKKGEVIPFKDTEEKININDTSDDIPIEVFEGIFSEQDFVKSEKVSVKEYAEELGFKIKVKDDETVIKNPYQTNRLIVKSKYSINCLDAVEVVEGYNDLHIVQFDDLESTLDALEYYENNLLVDYVEPDLVMKVQTTMPRYNNHFSWGSNYIGIDEYVDSFDGNLDSFYDVTVGVIDTGIDYNHELLLDRVERTYFNASGSGNADDEYDDHGHGTHVAGIVFDNTSDNVKIRAYKCLDDTGYGPLSSVVLCMEKAIEDGVDIINMSLSEEGTSDVMADTVQTAINNGITVCVAAGNDSDDAANYTPANIHACVTVGALDPLLGTVTDYHLASFSNYGSCVDVVAPGKTIGSTFTGNTYQTLNGTSMACPFVSAAFAMFLSYDNTLTTDEMMTIMREHKRTDWRYDSATPVSSAFAVYIGGYIFSIPHTKQPEFSVPEGVYSNNVTLAITCPEETGANIYYLLNDDGSNENITQRGTLYTEPFVLRQTTTVKAVAICGDKLESEAVTATYTINKNYNNPNEAYYIIDENGYISLYDGPETDVVVPDSVDGKKVVGIKDGGAFKDNSTIRSVVLPSTCTYIGSDSFRNCSNLVEISGEGVDTIHFNAFDCCTSLTDVDFENLSIIRNYGFYKCNNLSNISFDGVTYLGKYALSYCNMITEVSSDTITNVSDYSFYYMNGLNTVNLPNVTNISKGCFSYCNNLKNINLPKVTNLDSKAFEKCIALEKIFLPKLKTMDSGGYQFSECNMLSEVDFPNFTGSIFGYCFNNDTSLSVVKLPKAYASYNYSFKGCNNLSMLYIPKAKYIHALAFWKLATDSYNDKEFVIFAPNLVWLKSVPCYTDVKVFCSEKLITITNADLNDNVIPISFYAPSGSTAQTYAEEQGFNFTDSYNLTNDVLETVELRMDGIRFSSKWDDPFGLNEYANAISYGFEYTVGEESYTVEATNILENSNNDVSFNLVISEIPNDKVKETIKVQTVVTVDGMIFKKSDRQTTYFELARDPVYRGGLNMKEDFLLNDEDIQKLIDLSIGVTDPSSIDNFSLCDINSDGVIDGFDVSLYDKSIKEYCRTLPSDNFVSYTIA